MSSIGQAPPAGYDADWNRQQAYRDESDPLFFKWQRGEATEQEWLDKVAEIRSRYPDVEPPADEPEPAAEE